MIGPGLALTARHVIEACLQTHEGIEPQPLGEGELEHHNVNFNLHALQFLDDHTADLWSVVRVDSSGHSDVAALRLERETDNARQLGVDVSSFPGLELIPPSAGDRVEAIGYTRGSVQYPPDEPMHLDLDPRLSVGEVNEVHMLRRDTAMLPFPSFRTNAEFAPGMSGGPVYDSDGSLCGIVCSSVAGNDADEPISYAALLWPCCAVEVDVPLLQDTEPGATYPLLELGRSGAIEMNGVERVSLVENVAQFDTRGL